MSNNKLDKYAGIFKALSNPNRLKIFISLATCCKPGTIGILDSSNTACVGDIGRGLEIVPSTVSHHIKELHRAGLLRMERSGRHVQCWVEQDILRELSGFFRLFGKGTL